MTTAIGVMETLNNTNTNGNMVSEVNTTTKTDDELLSEAHYNQIITFMPVIVWMTVITIVGFVGNIITILFYWKIKQKSSAYTLITALAICDFLVCINGAGSVADLFVNVLYNNYGVCKTMYFMDHWTIVTSIWILWLISIDRYRKVCKPFRRQLSSRGAIYAIVILTGASLATSLNDFWTFEPVAVNLTVSDSNVIGHYCTNTDEENMQIVVWVGHTVDAMFVMFVLTTFLYTYGGIWKLLRSHQKENKHAIANKSVHKSKFKGTLPNVYRCQNTKTKSTKKNNTDNADRETKSESNAKVFQLNADLYKVANSLNNTSIENYDANMLAVKCNGYIDNCDNIKHLEINKKFKGVEEVEVDKTFDIVDDDKSKSDINEGFVVDDKDSGCHSEDANMNDSDSSGVEMTPEGDDTQKDTLTNYNLDTDVRKEAIIIDEQTVHCLVADVNTVELKVNGDKVFDGLTNEGFIEDEQCEVKISIKRASVIKNEQCTECINNTQLIDGENVLNLPNGKTRKTTTPDSISNHSNISQVSDKSKISVASKVKNKLDKHLPNPSKCERNITIMMFAVSVGFLICFVPYFIVNIGIRILTETSHDEYAAWVQFLLRAPFWNSSINPILFSIFNPKYRKFAKQKLMCMCKSTEGADDGLVTDLTQVS